MPSFKWADEKSTGIVTYCNEYTVTGKSGREYTFEWHDYLGPTFLTKTGRMMVIERIPQEAWDAFGAWWKATIKPNLPPVDESKRLNIIDLSEAA